MNFNIETAVLLRSLDEGESMNEVAHQFNINKSTVCFRLDWDIVNQITWKERQEVVDHQHHQMVKIVKVDTWKTAVDVTN